MENYGTTSVDEPADAAMGQVSDGRLRRRMRNLFPHPQSWNNAPQAQPILPMAGSI